MDSFSCPFCDFSDRDSYFLLQHVELIHPENGESPFIAAGPEEDEDRPSSSRQGNNKKEVAVQHKQTPPASASFKESPATYIECPYNCGELVASAELNSHTDFHLAENMAFEEQALRPVQFSTGACIDEQAVKDISSHFSTDLPKALRRDDDSSRVLSPRKSSLKEILFGGSPRHAPAKVSGGGTKRLGVRCPRPPKSSRLLMIFLIESRTWSLRSREANATVAEAHARGRRQGHTLQSDQSRWNCGESRGGCQ